MLWGPSAYSIEFTMDKKVLDTISEQKAIEILRMRKKALNTHLCEYTSGAIRLDLLQEMTKDEMSGAECGEILQKIPFNAYVF